MKILLYSDPHEGLNRVANMTHASAAALREVSFSQTMKILTELKQPGMSSFCLGDLFDQYSNSEAVIQQATELVQRTSIVLAGNHDVSNRKDCVSSLSLLHQFYGDKILIAPYGTSDTFELDVGKTKFLFVPHVANQELFEQALTEAVETATAGDGWRVLCLHCNYASGREMQDTALNLTRERASELLATFHTIFLGHEHAPSEDFNGRLVILGNTHPTGFSDISDKRIVVYDTETGAYESLKTLTAAAMVWQGALSELPAEPDAVFLDLVDDLAYGEGFKRVNALFKSGRHYAIRLRSKEAAKNKPVVAQVEAIETLPEVVAKDLEENREELLPLWQELLSEIGT